MTDTNFPTTDKANPNEYLTLMEAAGILKMHKRTVERMIRSGKIIAVNVSNGQQRKRWRVLRSSIQA